MTARCLLQSYRTNIISTRIPTAFTTRIIVIKLCFTDDFSVTATKKSGIQAQRSDPSPLTQRLHAVPSLGSRFICVFFLFSIDCKRGVGGGTVFSLLPPPPTKLFCRVRFTICHLIINYLAPFDTFQSSINFLKQIT